MRPGDVFAGRFEVERLAGSGGMAVVYRAKDIETGEPVALKVLREGGVGAAERLEREGRILAEIRHPGIVRHVSHGRTDAGDLYLALEWLEGEPLAKRLEHGPLTPGETVVLGLHVAEALGELHARGLVHRDVKPSNLFLLRRRVDDVKLLDFGIARRRWDTSFTGTGLMVGTVGYMAPEQARASEEIDARADVYALGCVLFRCLTGRLPFEGDDATAILVKIVLDEAPRVSGLRPGVPAPFDDLVAQLLSKDPDRRPKDGVLVAEELAGLGRLGTLPPAPPVSDATALTFGEQRLVCIVLVRTGLEEGPDASTLATLRAAANARGARLEPLADGSCVAAFHGEAAATDLARQAARSALELRSSLPNARLALTTGRAVLGVERPLGEAVDRAARLLRSDVELREEGGHGIRIDEATAGLLGMDFEIRVDEGVFELRAEHEPGEVPRTLLGKPTPCVGREGEIGTLFGALVQCLDDPSARAVLVTGIPGIGKSRLRQEFLRRAHERFDSLEVLVARGDPLSAGSSFGMLAQAIRRAVRIRQGEPMEVRRRKLESRVAQLVPAGERARVAAYLGELVGTPVHSGPARARFEDPVLLGDRMRRACEDFLAAACAVQPVILVLEDLQWGDLPTVTLVDAVLRQSRDRPLLVLAFGRPEVRETFPDLWQGRPVTHIHLGELPRRAAELLVRTVLGESLSRETMDRLVIQAGGNAFYLEELIRSAAEGRGELPPPTALAMAQARLERLPEDARRILRAASVFGQVFWAGGVHSLLGGVDRPTARGDWLEELVHHELLSRREDTRYPGEREIAFRHGLVRDAAYSMLTDTDRMLGHRLAAEWLEDVGPVDPVTLAEHYERGGERGRAIAWYRRAAEAALEGTDLDAVLARAERAEACGAVGATLGDLRVLEAEAHRWRGRFQDSMRCGLAAMRLLPQGSALWCHAAGEVALAALPTGDADALVSVAEAIGRTAVEGMSHALAIAAARAATQLLFAGRYDLADRLLEGAESVRSIDPEPFLASRVHLARAFRAQCHGNVSEAVAEMEIAVTEAERAGDARGACTIRTNLGSTCRQIGDFVRAAEVLRDALHAAERMGIHSTSALARHNLGPALAALGSLPEALDAERKAVERFEEQGELRLEAASRAYYSILLVQAGRPEAAEDEAQRAVESLVEAPSVRAHALAALAHARLALGRPLDALAAAEKAMAILSELGEIEEGESLIRLVHAESLLAGGDAAGAERALATALERLVERGNRIPDPGVRRRFLERIPENARTLELAVASRDR